jgi:hypothetical protein
MPFPLTEHNALVARKGVGQAFELAKGCQLSAPDA